jgi:hypothetical protein
VFGRRFFAGRYFPGRYFDPGPAVSGIAIALSPVVVEVVVPAFNVGIPRTIALSPVIVEAVVPAISVNTGLPVTEPTGGTVKIGLISDRPQITYDGSGLVNRIIPFGVNYDGSDLTLEFASPESLPYAIQHDGDAWYIEDATSIATYGLYEQKVYRSDVKVPPTHDNATTGMPGQPTGLNQQLLTIGAACTAGDLISFTWLGVTYTYTFASSPGNGEIGIGATAGEQQQLISAAFSGSDGHNLNYDVISLGRWYNNIAVMNASQRGDIGISATFTSASNYLGGGQDGQDPPVTSPPASAPTALGGGDLGMETANVLYALAVNTLIKQRSEILGLRVVVANGADIWALPGDRMQVKYRGIADTAESLAVNGNSRVVWLDIDEPMLVVERHDRSDPSGIRQVEFMLACPTIQYPVPAIPTWDNPVSLPVPSNTGSFPGSDEGNPGDNPPFEGYTPPDIPPYTPAADWVADTIGDILTGNKLPFPSCCPDPTTDITSGTGQLPPVESQLAFTGLAGQSHDVSSTDAPSSHSTTVGPLHAGLAFAVSLNYSVAGGPRLSPPPTGDLTWSLIGSMTTGRMQADVYKAEVSEGFSGEIGFDNPGGNLSGGTVDDVGSYDIFFLHTNATRIVDHVRDTGAASSLAIGMPTEEGNQVLGYLFFGDSRPGVTLYDDLRSPTADDADANETVLAVGNAANVDDDVTYRELLAQQRGTGPNTSIGWTWPDIVTASTAIVFELAP